MPIDYRYSAPGSVVTLLSTELNSLANNQNAITSAGVDPTSDRHLFGDLELAVTFGSSPTEDTTVEVYFLPTVDGTNYPNGATGTGITPKSSLLVAVFALHNQTAQRHVMRYVGVPNSAYKVLLRNKSGVSFPASGSTVKLLPYSTRGV